MKRILSNILCVLLSAFIIAGGVALLVCDLPEDLIWNLFGAVLMFTGISAIFSKIITLLNVRRGRI